LKSPVTVNAKIFHPDRFAFIKGQEVGCMEVISDHFLHKFFYPESVAVIGSSGDPKRINHNLFSNLVKLGYKGRVYPVNPKEKEILGIRCYPSVQDIEEIVDLAVIASLM
jgi:hypothetical protein